MPSYLLYTHIHITNGCANLLYPGLFFLFPHHGLVSVYVQIGLPSFCISRGLLGVLMSVLDGWIKIRVTLWVSRVFLILYYRAGFSVLRTYLCFCAFYKYSYKWKCKGQRISCGIFILLNECRFPSSSRRALVLFRSFHFQWRSQYKVYCAFALHTFID